MTGSPVSIGTIAYGTTRLFIGTADAATAFGVTNDIELTATLPADGQVCFVNTANIKIHSCCGAA